MPRPKLTAGVRKGQMTFTLSLASIAYLSHDPARRRWAYQLVDAAIERVLAAPELAAAPPPWAAAPELAAALQPVSPVEPIEGFRCIAVHEMAEDIPYFMVE